jgi:tetratricopeptide (TPR) repeat protein
LQVLVNFLDISLSARDFDAFRQFSSALGHFAPSTSKLQARAVLLRIHLDLRYAMITGDFEPGLRAGVLAESAMEKHAKAFDPSIEASVLFNLSALYFLHGDHKRALQAINQILNRQSTSIRQDIADAARLLEMAIHLDQRNLDLVESLQRAMHRRLRLHPRSEDFENILVRGLKRWWEALPDQQAALLKETYEKSEIWRAQPTSSGAQKCSCGSAARSKGYRPPSSFV